MKKIIQYLNDNGLLKTIAQIFKRLAGLTGLLESKTYILKKEIHNEYSLAANSTSKYQIKILDVEDIEAFNKMKYFEFLDANKIISSKKMGAIIALKENNIIGYVCFDSNNEHPIHQLGRWYLEENEAWIGPTYILNDYRNKGLHRILLNKTIENLYYANIRAAFTAINYKNKPSIKSFKKIGFDKIGLIKARNFFNLHSKVRVEEKMLGSIESKFFNNKG
ncbi:GNAT family N-acetyltransferase [Tetragenococcus halophilus]|uniref:GNAT family N-acetyltransferase n=1 Tax=Tetragenococcus halophilus TaxID=51669 RepID=UPI00209B3B44|nr:GNAT family N-acetyltransferase [Tetragenococcus halophilus]MCO8291380.1 GNAT family N-acetyltransferase [Tetragenococcus halophilus]